MKSVSPKLEWTDAWLTDVANGTVTMSQRKLTSIEKHGGLAALKKSAKAKNLHVLLLKDDKGQELAAVSKEPFKILC